MDNKTKQLHHASKMALVAMGADLAWFLLRTAAPVKRTLKDELIDHVLLTKISFRIAAIEITIVALYTYWLFS